MSAAAEAIYSVSFMDFLAGEQAAEQRHELVGGRVYPMAGGSERHDLAARAAGCRPFTSNRLLRTQGPTYYPDILIVCGPAAHRLYEQDAALIVEVLSRTTEAVDRRERATHYAGLPGLGLYLLLDPESRRVEVARIEAGAELTWQVFGPGGVVPTRYGDLDVDALYDALDASVTT